MNETKWWTCMWIVVVLCLTFTVCLSVCKSKEMEAKYVEHGYTRATLPGCNCAQWVKEVR